jgi:chromosome partitioning protein
MPVIAVVNPKGGVGKTTLATNIAGWLASRGKAVMLGDVDRQASARAWLSLRPAAVPPIRHWDIDGSIARPPRASPTWCSTRRRSCRGARSRRC